MTCKTVSQAERRSRRRPPPFKVIDGSRLDQDLRILGTTKLIEAGDAGVGHRDGARTTFAPKHRRRPRDLHASAFFLRVAAFIALVFVSLMALGWAVRP